jgi:outer membrane protein assembly factor BamB
MVSIMTLIEMSNQMKTKEKQGIVLKRFIWVFIILFYVLAVPLVIRNVITSKTSPWQIVEQSPEFTLIGIHEISTQKRRDDGSQELFLILRDNSLIFLKSFDVIFYQSNVFKQVNLVTGKLEWQNRLERSGLSVASNEHAFYVTDLHRVSGYSGKTLVRPGAILVMAYDIDTGDRIWSTAYEGFAFVSYLAANETEVRIGGHNGHGFDRDATKMDTHTGDILEGEVEAFTTTRKIRCQSEELPFYHHLKDLADCKVVIADSNAVYVLDLTTNSTVWQVEIAGVVSNLAVSNGVIYFLAQDGNFWALDEQTGTTLGHVQFEPVYPGRAELLDNVDYPAHTVVADGNGVALHFMETQQLFFFHFLRNGE